MGYSPNGKRLALCGVTCCSGGWSPQGNDIVFARHVNPDVHSSMWIVQADGTGLCEVPASPEFGCGGPNEDPEAGGCFDPRWSPDGTRIVFGAGSEDLGRNVYAVRPDGTGLTQVTHGGRHQSNQSPNWATHPLAH